MTSLLPLIVVVLLALVWLDGARAREFAIELARRYCDHRGLQFLDETVALARMGLRWTRQGLRIRRMFRFDFSLEGVGRRTGYVLMLGTRLEHIDAGLLQQKENPIEPVRTRPDGDEPTDRPPAKTADSNVIPFRRKGRRD